MIIMDLFDIDIHIFTVIKFLFNLGVRFNYISKDSIASRMKRRKNQQPNDDVDENNSYEY